LLLSIGEIGPLPDDAVITPVTFRVRRRHLRGILAAHDAQENDTRELAGEWVTTTSATQQHTQAADCKRRGGESRVVLYIHGGAFLHDAGFGPDLCELTHFSQEPTTSSAQQPTEESLSPCREPPIHVFSVCPAHTPSVSYD